MERTKRYRFLLSKATDKGLRTLHYKVRSRLNELFMDRMIGIETVILEEREIITWAELLKGLSYLREVELELLADMVESEADSRGINLYL